MLINLKCVIEVSDFSFFPYFLTNYTFKNVAEFQRKKTKTLTSQMLIFLPQCRNNVG